MNERKTIVLVLKSGGDFSLADVELIVRHIRGKWQSTPLPRILCLWDKASSHYNFGNFEMLPLNSKQPGTWSRIALYSPEMDKYRPFLYVDLDTVVVQSIEKIFDLVQDPNRFITLEDFWQRGELATGLVWFPATSDKVRKIWANFTNAAGNRMDRYIRQQIGKPDVYWQELTTTIYDFKARKSQLLTELPADASLVCLHGKPRIFNVTHIEWLEAYKSRVFPSLVRASHIASVIIPYNRDRGWLRDAIDSVPENAQLILSKGDGNWPENFNKALDKVECPYVRWLHEDDMLTPNSIDDAVAAIEEQDVDFIHGPAIEIFMNPFRSTQQYTPPIKHPTVNDLLHKNILHSATMLYKREVFEKVGKMDETLFTAEEFEFNLRCLKAGLKIGYCETPLAFYRRHPQQKVRVVSKEEKDKEREQVRALYR